MDNHRRSSRSSRRNSYRRASTSTGRRASFILVSKDEEDEMNSYSYSFIGHLGIPILYVLAGASVLSGIVCMGVISNYWANLEQPMCFLYSQTPTAQPIYMFGSSVSCCYWVAFGGIPPLLICVACGFLYVFHVRDDKDVTSVTYGCVVAMSIATIFLLAVTCTLSQGLRITCTSKSLNPANNKAQSCQGKIDAQVDGYNLPINTSSMISATMAAYWTGWCCFALITIFHVALVVRRLT